MTDVAVLDVNETLFSLASVGSALDAVGIGADRLDLWFARLLRDGFAVTAMGDAVAFPDLVDHHVRQLGRELEVEVTGADVDRVIDAFDEVTAHEDVAEGLRALHAGGCRSVPFTNGSAAIARRFLERAGLDGLVEDPRDVDDAGAWKPAPAAYRWLCTELGVEPSDAAMVAVHPWDVAGAMRAGLAGAWLDRDGDRWPPFLAAPDVSAAALPTLAAALVG